jgi:hypothetical protein
VSFWFHRPHLSLVEETSFFFKAFDLLCFQSKFIIFPCACIYIERGHTTRERKRSSLNDYGANFEPVVSLELCQ